MRTSKAEVDLFNLTPEGQDFSMEFWQQIVGDPDEVAAGVDAEYHPIRIKVFYDSHPDHPCLPRPPFQTYLCSSFQIHVLSELSLLQNPSQRAVGENLIQVAFALI